MKCTFKRSLPLVMALMILLAMPIIPVFADGNTAIAENLFKVAAPGEPSFTSLRVAMTSSTQFYTSSPISVAAGDVLYFGPCNPNQSYYMVRYDAEGVGVTGNVTKASTETHATLGNGNEILKYTVPAGTAYVCMIAPNALAKTTVMTKNAPFGESDWQAYVSAFDVNATVPIDPDSVLRGKNALFIGDSINAGSYDVLAPTAGRAFAGRMAISTGLNVTNKSVGGATLLKRSDKSWIVDQLNSQKGQDFDLIVIFGGVNDARHNILAGKYIENPAALQRINTFAAGLQYLLLNAKENHPNAQIFYVSCFQLPGHNVGMASDMSAHVAVADEICEKYEVNFIDLYNNDELIEKLQPDTVRYLPDLLHPTSEGYDLITPYIQSEVERVMREKLNSENTGEVTTEVTTEPATSQPILKETVKKADTADPAVDSASEAQSGGCSSSVFGGISVIALVSGAAVLVSKKKKEE